MIRVSVFIEAMNMLTDPQLFCTLAGYKGRAVEGGNNLQTQMVDKFVLK